MNRAQQILNLALGHKDSPKKLRPERQPLKNIDNVSLKTSSSSVPNYVRAFDTGRWEELDRYLKASVKIPANVKAQSVTSPVSLTSNYPQRECKLNEGYSPTINSFPDDAVVFSVTPSGQLEPLSKLAFQWTPSNKPNLSFKGKRLFQEEFETQQQEQDSPKKLSPERQPLKNIDIVSLKTSSSSLPNDVRAFDTGKWEEELDHPQSECKLSEGYSSMINSFPDDAMECSVTPSGHLEPLLEIVEFSPNINRDSPKKLSPERQPLKNIENVSLKTSSSSIPNDVRAFDTGKWEELDHPQSECKLSEGYSPTINSFPDDAMECSVTPSGQLEPLLEIVEFSPNINRDMSSEPPKKKKRRWDRKNFCLFCEKLVTNFSRHMLKIHSDEEPVLRYCAVMDENLKLRKKRRQEIFDELRKRGNFVYNQSVLRESLTPPTSNMLLLVKRRSVNITKDKIEDNIICKMCSGYFSRKTFYKHSEACKMNMPSTEEQYERNKINAIKENGLELRIFSEEANELMKEKIFPLLRKDERGIAAMNDPLIVSVGCDFLSNHLDLKDRYNITSHMRDAGILLLKMKEKDSSILSLKDCLQSNQLENLTAVVQDICKHNSETGQVGVVGGPARLAWVIKECTARMLDDTLSCKTMSENYKQAIKGQILDFQMLIKRRWKYIVSTNAEKTRKKNAMKKEVVMPDNEDIKTFLTEITSIEEAYAKKLTKEVNAHSYERLCEAIIAKLIVLNRRRSGEVANAELEFYLKRPSKGTVSQEILDQLTEEEAHAFKMFDMIIIPGKIIRAVPILMTKDTARNIDLIISCRKVLNIPETNKLLFPRPGTENPFVGSHVLRIIRQSMELKKPNHLTATGLRHHCATMSHYSDKNLDKEDLAEHMGHTLETHKRKYRFPLEVVQKSVIAPHLVKLNGFSIQSMPQSTSPDLQRQAFDDDVDDPDSKCLSETDSDEENTVVKKSKKTTRRRWTENEKRVVIMEFQDFIKSSSNPGSKLCKTFIEKEPILKGRTWAQVNVLIDNYNKGKLALPLEFRHLRS